MQEVGRHNGQRMNAARKLKMSQTLLSNILMADYYIQTDLAKFKGLLIKIKVVKKVFQPN